MVWMFRFLSSALVCSTESSSMAFALKGRKAANCRKLFAMSESSKRTFSTNKSFSTFKSPVFWGGIFKIIPSCRPVVGRLGFSAIKSASLTPSFFSKR